MSRPFATITLAALLFVSAAGMTSGRATSAKGPPWISIEYPASPYDATTRNSFLLVHAYHHGTPMNFPVSGTAEGVVGGQRRTIPLTFTRTSREGVYALRQQWPASGNWVLAIDVNQGGDSRAGALIVLGSTGEVVKVSVPTTRRDGWDIPRAITSAEIDAALQARVAVAGGR